jgi:hypothetical protein
MTADQRYDEAKFTELVLYVAQQLEDDPEGGATKLNKALWWAECAHMRMYGRSMSGAEYQKLPQGPAPRRLVPVRNALIKRGEAVLENTRYLGLRQDRLIPKRRPDMNRITEQEQEIVDQVIAAIKGKTATQVSAESHEEMGWKMVGYGETIPVSSAYLVPAVAVTPEMQNRAKALAERFGITG